MHTQTFKPFTAVGPRGPCAGYGFPPRHARAMRLTSRAATAPQQGESKQPSWAPPSGILKINPDLLQNGGLDPASEAPPARAAFVQHLSSLFLPINLDHPGIRILNIDPPVITVAGFLTAAECDDIIATASASGLMRQSGVGVGGYQVADREHVRTSSTLAATQEALAQHPALAGALGVMLSRARGLLRGPLPSEGAAAFARPSAAGQVAFELPQVARYQPGQHFLTHEDAFPAPVVGNKGYQRRATLLVYLNDCEEGGATHFDVLGMGVQPRKGTALLFFPAFANGMPDRRTLHTATDAISEKWVTQLWVSVGVKTAAAGQQQLPGFVRGVKGSSGAPPSGGKGRKRGVPMQRINTKI